MPSHLLFYLFLCFRRPLCPLLCLYSSAFEIYSYKSRNIRRAETIVITSIPIISLTTSLQKQLCLSRDSLSWSALLPRAVLDTTSTNQGASPRSPRSASRVSQPFDHPFPRAPPERRYRVREMLTGFNFLQVTSIRQLLRSKASCPAAVWMLRRRAGNSARRLVPRLTPL